MSLKEDDYQDYMNGLTENLDDERYDNDYDEEYDAYYDGDFPIEDWCDEYEQEYDYDCEDWDDILDEYDFADDCEKISDGEKGEE